MMKRKIKEEGEILAYATIREGSDDSLVSFSIFISRGLSRALCASHGSDINFLPYRVNSGSKPQGTLSTGASLIDCRDSF